MEIILQSWRIWNTKKFKIFTGFEVWFIDKSIEMSLSAFPEFKSQTPEHHKVMKIFHLTLLSVFRPELEWLETKAYYENSGTVMEKKSQVTYRTSAWGLQKLFILIWLELYKGILLKIPFLIWVWLLSSDQTLKHKICCY